MISFPRSRRQTRAALLSHLLTAGDSFRGELVERLDLTEASISRIVAELKSEDLVSEYARRPAPYPGGPTNVVAINRSIRVAGVELSNGRLSAGVGNLAGALECTQRHVLSPNADAQEVERAVIEATEDLSRWAQTQGVAVRQVAISLPGFGAVGDINAIVPSAAQSIKSLVQARFAQTPVVMTNSVQAQAALHGFGIHAKALDEEHLFLFVGHGIGAARIGNMALGAEHRPVEIGHMVMDVSGPRCRCGHSGCLEAYAGLPALAAVFGLPEQDLLADGDRSLQSLPMVGAHRTQVESMLGRLGTALGNALNIDPVSSIVVAGWPSLVPQELRQRMLDALDASVLGGIARRGLEVTFIPPSIGNDPLPALCYAAYAFVQRGAMDADTENQTSAPRARAPRKAAAR